jgi:hypothetical protein
MDEIPRDQQIDALIAWVGDEIPDEDLQRWAGWGPLTRCTGAIPVTPEELDRRWAAEISPGAE